MKKANIINLIKYYSENNDSGFRTESYKIAEQFDQMGDYQLSEYILALLSNASTFVPQINSKNFEFIRKINTNENSLPIPNNIKTDIIGIMNASKHAIGVNKFLFQGHPGTGKTEVAKQIARILDKELYIVDFTSIIDSKLGQTSKNISKLFEEINSLDFPNKILILFDEIDGLILDRADNKDVREIGRSTTTFFKHLEELNSQILLIATTNLYNFLDKALIRRFDSVINFDRYTQEDLLEIAELILNNYLVKFKNVGKNIRLFKKIINLMPTIPYPGDLKNMIKTALAFSEPDDEFDYLRILYKNIYNQIPTNEDELSILQSQNFTVREIEILTKISKSQVSRKLQGKLKYE